MCAQEWRPPVGTLGVNLMLLFSSEGAHKELCGIQVGLPVLYSDNNP
jgi:hypothetical protein